ncbi:hypothetical protein HB943_00550 [Listeria weihenstephanensis]|uniref:Teichoic acid/polysaccharide export protein n=1 Tax=Listeria weihenstephanensis TaxID=1006155 RepID=A0A841Z1D8_9LIST|nr:lipid II flippase MurJ [Listeria weihenstephanensis]MBC1499070.1 hypothetical protein [Listeria weihenstephanensis]
MHIKTTQITKIIGSTFLLSIFAQLLGLVRNILLAKEFGIGGVMNAFLLANTYTNLVSNITVSAIAVVIIPYLIQEGENGGREDTLQTYMATMCLFTAFLCLGIGIISYFIFPLISENANLAIRLMLLLMIIPFFRTGSAFLGALRNFKKDFITSKIALLVMAIVNVSYLLLANSPTISGIALVLSGSYGAEYVILKLKNRSYHCALKWEWREPAFQKLVRQSAPLMVTEGAFQLSVLLTSSIMGWLSVAYLPAMNYVNILVSIVQALLLLNILTVLFPKISWLFSTDTKAAKEALLHYMSWTNMIVIWIVAIFIAIGDKIIEMLFQHGAFTTDNTQMVYAFLIVTVLALPGLVIRDFLYRAFYALGNTKKPSFISLSAIVGVIVMLLVLLPLQNVYLLLSIPVITTYCSSIWAYKKLQGLIGKIDVSHKLLKQHGIMVIQAFMMGWILYLIKSELSFNVYINVLILLVLGMIIYVCGLLVATRIRRCSAWMKF